MKYKFLIRIISALIAVVLSLLLFACESGSNLPKSTRRPLSTDKTAPGDKSDCSEEDETHVKTEYPKDFQASHKPQKLSDNLQISEVSPANISVVINGNVTDWFEIYNGTGKSVKLSDYFASDDEKNTKKSKLPDVTLESGCYTVVSCETDVSFSLSADGETLVLADKNGNIVDKVILPAVPDDYVVPADNVISRNATPGFPNSDEFYGKYILSKKGLLINEVVTSGDDRIELINAGDSDVNLGNYYASDKLKNKLMWKLPDKVLRPGEFFVIKATGETSSDTSCAPFSLGSDGDSVVLTRSDGKVETALYVPKMPSTMSMGLSDGKYVFFKEPTIGKANGGGSYPGISVEPVSDVLPGIYTNTQKITFSAYDGGVIYYTLDGSDPSASSPKYDGKPLDVASNTTIKLININGNEYKSGVVSFTFLFNLPAYELDVMNLSLDSDDFRRMYDNYSNDDIEIPCSASYFKGGKQEFSINCGIKLNGQTSRAFDKKSFKLSFKAKYGASKLKYKFFDNFSQDEFDRLVLRSGAGAQASYAAYINDEFCTSIVTDSKNITNVYSQSYKPVNLYINGEYFGLYFVREKVNEDFVANHLNVSPESVSVITEMSYLEYGSTPSNFDEIWNFVKNKDLRVKENFDYIEKRVCLESVADYYILESWCANFDSSNVRIFRSSENDGKWRFIYYDLDYAFAYPENSPKVLLSKMRTDTCDGLTCCNALFYKLFKTESFREIFFERLELLCASDLAPVNTQKRWDELFNLVRHDMSYNIERWKGHDCEPGAERTHNSMAEWEQVANKVKSTYLSESYMKQFKDCFYEMGREFSK